MSKVILITGASRGFGKIWTEAFLKRGDKVAATVRNLESLKDLKSQYSDQLLPVQLDVNNREASFAAVKEVAAHFGRIDVLINNAGYGLFGAIEETSEAEARSQMETNFFGVLWLSQAVLPVMRAQQSGHIIQVSSFLGLITLPVLGIYNASKFAVEGLSETLASELKDFGIHVTLVEPNGYTTDWAGASAVQTTSIDAYNPVKQGFQEASSAPDIFGDPQATAGPILDLIDNSNPPLRVLFGKFAYAAVTQAYKERLSTFETWKSVSEAAHGN